MPVMHFHVRWPDQRKTRCYSPSLVITDYFQPGQSYALPDFLSRSREALGIASDRVLAKYGFACSAAMDQLAEIEAIAETFAATDQVAIISFE
jgi:uncharacterized repeat protein (TIGR04042 family)